MIARMSFAVIAWLAQPLYIARSPNLGGFLERLALWPAYLLLPMLALRLDGRRRGL